MKLRINLFRLAVLFSIISCGKNQYPWGDNELNSNLNLNQVPACRKEFSKNEHKRRAPPDDFLISLFRFISNNCHKEQLFGSLDEPRDIFTHLNQELALSNDKTRKYRCAAMFELMRVSAAMESSYNWREGRDKSAANYSFETMEAGIFQTSANSHVHAHKGNLGRWEYLDKLTQKNGISPNNFAAWIKLQKNENKKDYIFEHHAYLLRHNFHHYGPMIDKKRVGQNISLDCIKEIENQF